jgi:8-oxo-dGTP diphosphatase
MKPLLVSAAIIENDGKVLLAQRTKTSRFGANKWEFPGGKVEFLESPQFALIREIKEELDVEIEGLDLLCENSHVYEDSKGKLHIVLLSYRCTVKSGTPKALDAQDIRWVSPGELASLELCEADKAIASTYIKKASE